jgi:hypothetical protein
MGIEENWEHDTPNAAGRHEKKEYAIVPQTGASIARISQAGISCISA